MFHYSVELAFAQSNCRDTFCEMQEGILSDNKRFRLPQVFFPEKNEIPKYVSIWSKVVVVYPNGTESCGEENSPTGSGGAPRGKVKETWYWTHRWARSPILKLLGDGNLYVHMSASSFLSLAVLLLNQIGIDDISHKTCDVESDCIKMSANVSLGCTPDEASIRDLWESVIQWVSTVSILSSNFYLTNSLWQSEAYAVSLAAANIVQPDESNIGYIIYFADGWKTSDSYKPVHDNTFTDLIASFLLTQILLNITVAVLVIWCFPIHIIEWSAPDPSHERVSILSNPKSVAIRLYWSFFLLGGLVFLLLILAEFTRYLWFAGSFKYQLINMSSVVVLLIIELAFAIIISKEIRHLYVPRGFVFVGSVLCLDIITKKRRHYRAIVAASLWILMGFCQISAASVVPLVILLMISFIRTLSSVAIFYSLLFFTLIVMASIANNLHRLFHGNRSWLRATVEVASLIVIICFITSAIVLFWILILDGFKANSITDLLWSLGLPAALSGVAVYMRNVFLKEIKVDATAKESKEEKIEEKNNIALDTV